MNHKKKIRRWKARTFCFRKTGVVHYRSGTCYALLLGYFGLKFLPDIRHCVYWVLAEVWALDSFHKISKKSFIGHCQGRKEVSFMCETVFIFFMGEYSSVWPEICRVWSQIQWRFLGGISGIKLFRENFSEILCKPRPNFWPSFSKFIMGPYCAEKNSHKHFRMLFAPRQGGTSINESQKEDTGTKSQDVLFSENRFCSLSTWDLLRLTPWVFWSEIFTRHSPLCLLSFGSGLSPRFVPQDWLYIFYSSLPGLKGRFVCVWNCLIFFVGEYSSVWPEICLVLSQIQWRFLGRIWGKNYSRRIFQNFCANQGYQIPA